MTKVDNQKQAFQDWERAAKEAGIFYVRGGTGERGQLQSDRHNKYLWEARASKRQSEIIR